MLFQGIGFSTGTLRNSHSYEEAIVVYRALGCTAVEISPSHIFSVLERPSGFAHVSTHDAPERPYARGDVSSLERLKALEEKARILQLDRVVLHPDHVADWDLLKEYDIPWGIENLDARSARFGIPDELAPVLDEYDLPLVLDLNHCYTRDPSLELARSFQKRFAGRIVEQHVSGYRDVTATGRHLPLHETQQAALLDVLDPSVPTIIEIDECTIDALEREFAYVRA